MRRLCFSAIVAVSVVLGACADEDKKPAPTATSDDADDAIVSADPLAMPKDIRTYESAQGWFTMHLRWHTERQWNLMSPSDLSWAKNQGWSAATIQEGAAGNGLQFLAMHRIMLRTLIAQFPKEASLFAGWTSPPTDPKDKADPLPHGATTAFDSGKDEAIDKVMNDIGSFASDDDFGLYLETSLRPTKSSPGARSSDASVGLHNYLHNRFADASSKINIGDPSVNLQNKRFWRLHGWIDSRWTAFRAAKGLSETDPAYVAALNFAMEEMMPKDGATYGGDRSTGPAEAAPPSLLGMIFSADLTTPRRRSRRPGAARAGPRRDPRGGSRRSDGGRSPRARSA